MKIIKIFQITEQIDKCPKCKQIFAQENMYISKGGAELTAGFPMIKCLHCDHIYGGEWSDWSFEQEIKTVNKQEI